MRNFFALFVAITTLSSQYTLADSIYKCKNQQGELLYQEKPCAEKSHAISSWGSSSASALVIAQGDQGHFFVDANINTHKLNFVVDTGASLVTLPQTDAHAAGLSCQRKVTIKTGNGEVAACMTTISSLKFGSFTLKNIQAIIAPNLSQPLLGMNALKQFRIEQEGGEMRITTK